MSFQSLQPDARACLGIMSLLSADWIPSEIFTPSESDDLLGLPSFCEDELRYVLAVCIYVKIALNIDPFVVQPR